MGIKSLKSGENIFFGCFQNKELVSIASTIIRYEDFAFLGNIYTKPNCRGKGLGTKTVSHLIDFLFEKADVKAAQLYTTEEKMTFYNKLGFNVIETLHKFYEVL